MTEREHFRDEALGTALRELEVPEHRPDFDRELQALLAGPRRGWRVPAGSAIGQCQSCEHCVDYGRPCAQLHRSSYSPI